jgi:hypothetical protein
LDSNKQRHFLSISICWNLCSSIFTAEFRKFYFPVNIFALLTKQTNVFVLFVRFQETAAHVTSVWARGNDAQIKWKNSCKYDIQPSKPTYSSIVCRKKEFRLFEICALLRNLNSPPNDQSSATRKCKTGNNANKTKWINNLFLNQLFLKFQPLRVKGPVC